MSLQNTTPNYLSSSVLQSLKERIKNLPYERKPLEHDVGSWMCTLLKNAFVGDPWALTSEQRDESSNTRPDFLVEKLENNQLLSHIICEIKKVGGDRMEKALHQAIKDKAETLDNRGISSGRFEIFVIVQRGLDIGFFEYHNDVSNLDEEGIPHFFGCVSLTQDQENIKVPAVVPSNTPGLKPLYFTGVNLKDDKEGVRKAARNYDIPCIFNIDQHDREISLMIYHIKMKNPRPSYI